jgi:hypothetical protein
MMRLDFWTWPLPVVDVGPNILLLLRAKLMSSISVSLLHDLAAFAELELSKPHPMKEPE